MVDDLMTPEQRRERHRAWLASFGFSERDWARIKAHAATVTPNNIPAAIDDLDAPWRVGAAWAAERRWSSGLLLGVWQGKALLAWPHQTRRL